ncbi:mast cell carboxypeptidase A-like [Pocillopora verrucosa]|uniref:mast cell carboxypeptidase A-like n=1 Tax=Pocillopora verrucosa TaxID=203993 RepID=UPI003341C790
MEYEKLEAEPEERTTICGRLAFGLLSRIIETGNKRPLKENNIPSLDVEGTKYLTEKLELKWKNEIEIGRVRSSKSRLRNAVLRALDKYLLSLIVLLANLETLRILNAHHHILAERTSGYKVIRVAPQSDEEVSSLRDLLQSRKDLDVWKAPSQTGREVHIHVGPDSVEDFQAHLAELSLYKDTIAIDTREMIDNQDRCCHGNNDFDNCYHTLDEIKQSRRKVKGLIFIACGIHAREWISPATCMYLIHQLLNFLDRDEEIANMTETFEWFFLPVFNVDGYEFTHKEDRLWRKNRRVFDSSLPADCIGVDLNRNFNNSKWGSDLNSHDTCSEQFSGESPFSEIESFNVATYLTDRRSDLIAFFDFHSYGQLWMSPWGWREDRPSDYDEMKTLMRAATDAIYKTSGKNYIYGPAYSTIYPTSGNSIDYTYDKLGVVHSYCVELRPGEEDRQGFFASACEISQTGREILVAFRAITPILAKQTETVDKAMFRIRKNKRKKWKRREKNRRRKERNNDSNTD